MYLVALLYSFNISTCGVGMRKAPMLPLEGRMRILLQIEQIKDGGEQKEVHPTEQILHGLEAIEGNPNLTMLMIAHIKIGKGVLHNGHRRVRATKIAAEAVRTHGRELAGKAKASGPVNLGKAIMTEGKLGTGCIASHDSTVLSKWISFAPCWWAMIASHVFC